MIGNIQKWGNSQAVRIPKALIEEAGLKEGDPVEISADNGRITIVKTFRHRSFKERIAGYEGDLYPGEWDTGKPVGKEVI